MIGSYGSIESRLLGEDDPVSSPKVSMPKWLHGDIHRHPRHDKPGSYRLLDRNAPFNQSNGSWRISRVNRSRRLYTADWFHTLLNSSFLVVMVLFCAAYIFFILVFAVFYFLISDLCSLEIHTYRAAVYFSTETIMTIGYGLPLEMTNPPYFDECNSALLIIILESLAGVFCDAVCLGLVFGRLSRGQTRATTVLFSDFAVVREIHGRLYFMFQTAEMRKHQLVEAHVRCYALTRHSYKNGTYFRTDAMRLSKPDDELGATLLMNFPTLIIHEIDQWSPFYYLLEKEDEGLSHEPSQDFRFPEIMQRDIDAFNGNRDAKKPKRTIRIDKKKAIAAWKEKKLEIVALIEGIDATTSCTIQARHSYTVEDFAWDHDFVPCVSESENGYACMNFGDFHKITKVVEPSSEPPNIFSSG